MNEITYGTEPQPFIYNVLFEVAPDTLDETRRLVLECGGRFSRELGTPLVQAGFTTEAGMNNFRNRLVQLRAR